MHQKMTEAYGKPIVNVLVDGGYVSQAGFETVTERGSAIYAPIGTTMADRGGRLGRDSVSPSISGSPAGWFRSVPLWVVAQERRSRPKRRPTTAAKFMLPQVTAGG